MVNNYLQPNGTCINELIVLGVQPSLDNLINSFPPEQQPQVVSINKTDASIILIADTPEIKLFEKLSGEHHVQIQNIFFNPEADYAGAAIFSHGSSNVNVETYYKGLYYYHPRLFWEEMQNLMDMMCITGGDWEEIEKEIDFCQVEDYNTIKDMFKGIVCITGNTKNN
jgi:hypothetical protein